MPTFMTERVARGLYSRPRPWTQGEEEPLPVTYGRELFELNSPFPTRVDTLVEMGVDGTAVVVGSGFGFLVEELLYRGVDAYGIEPGPYFWENPDEWDDEVKRRTFKGWVGSNEDFGTFDWVVDEDAITMHDDSELERFLDSLEDLGPNVVHFVSTGCAGNQAINWKTLEEWEKVAPDHMWIDLRA